MTTATEEAGMARRIAFIGLGAMGQPMARCLARGPFELAVFDRVAERAAPLVELDARAASSPADAARDVDVVVLMVVDAEQVRDVLFGADGASSAAAPGTVFVIMSTVGPEPVRAAAAQLTDAGSRLVDAPVSGGVARAQDADLLILAGAPQAELDAVAPVLDALGSSVVRCGDSVGDGQSVKLVNQLLCGVHIAAAAEALAYAGALGLDPAAVHQAIRHGAAGSFMLDDRGERMVRRAFDDPKSALDIFVKDLALVLDAAGEQRFPTPLAATANQLFVMGAAAGYAGDDDSGVVRVYEPWTDHAGS